MLMTCGFVFPGPVRRQGRCPSPRRQSANFRHTVLAINNIDYIDNLGPPAGQPGGGCHVCGVPSASPRPRTVARSPPIRRQLRQGLHAPAGPGPTGKRLGPRALAYGSGPPTPTRLRPTSPADPHAAAVARPPPERVLPDVRAKTVRHHRPDQRRPGDRALHHWAAPTIDSKREGDT